MKRRRFLKSSLVLGSAPLMLSGCDTQKNNPNASKKMVTGFIFSDAHIGWRGADQPSVEEQRQAIEVIKARFTDLDVVFDTGDIHHGYLNEAERNEARDHWLRIMANQFPESLFHYVPGNHELGKGPFDTELTATRLGSMHLRPYYSFDHMGVHFVSLPQLTDTILVNRESVLWLQQDLAMNRDKTTLIFSHNSIVGTTYDNGENGYRVVANSEELLAVMDQHPQVLGWFHGHNHQYEVVNKHNRLYVSNGRIGGFNPPPSWGAFGQGHLGGVYFSVSAAGLQVRCFSATENRFLDELGFPDLSNQLSVSTSFNPTANSHYYFGHGQLTDQVGYQINNHFLSNQNLQVFQQNHHEQVLNDNDQFQLSTDLYFIGKKIKRLVGYQLLPNSLERHAGDDGLLIEKNASEGDVFFNIPNHKTTMHGFWSRGSYYRCASGDQFIVEADCDDFQPATRLTVSHSIFNEHQERLYESSYKPMEQSTAGRFSCQLSVPEQAQMSDHTGRYLYLNVSVKMADTPQRFHIRRLVLKKVNQPQLNQLNLQDQLLVLSEGQVNQYSVNAPQYPMTYHGAPCSVVIKVPNVKWQVRNALATIRGEQITVHGYAHNFQKHKEVILTPTQKPRFFVNKTIGLKDYRVRHQDDQVLIELSGFDEQSLIIINTDQVKPTKVTGGLVTDLTAHKCVLKPQAKQVVVRFS